MPSFTSVTKLTRLPDLPNGAAHFSGVVDEVWSVNGSPHGGYLLGLVIYAINQFQASTDQPDIAHLMASFLRAARPGDIFLKVWIVKKGLRWTNLACEVWQKEQLLITNQALFTKMPPLPTHREPFSTTNQNLLPLTPSRYAPITPFLTHPSECGSVPKPSEFGRRWSSKKDSVLWFIRDGEMKWSFDPKIKKQKEEGRSLDWGAWCEFERKEDKVDTGALGTLAMTLQFHCALPLPPESPYSFAPNTVGCFSTGKQIHEGRHEQIVEVWSAPGPIGGEENKDPEWRKKSALLVTATQIALSVNIGRMKTGIKAKPESKI